MKSPEQLAKMFTVEALDRALIYKGAEIPEEKRLKFDEPDGSQERHIMVEEIKTLYQSTPPPEAALRDIDVKTLAEALFIKLGKKAVLTETEDDNVKKGIDDIDRREDIYMLEDEQIQANADRVAVICRERDLCQISDDFFLLDVTTYGDHFNLCESEPFHDQPTIKGVFCTAFLFTEDTVATAGHCPVLKGDEKDIRVVFGYMAHDMDKWLLKVHREDIYSGLDVPQKSYCKDDKEPDYAIVKLDRAVKGRTGVTLSNIKHTPGQQVYALGFPRGLPLKYSPGSILGKYNDHFFEMALNVFSGNSGSPLFDSETHELVGIVTKGYLRDFRYNGCCWFSAVYQSSEKSVIRPRCTNINELRQFLPGGNTKESENKKPHYRYPVIRSTGTPPSKKDGSTSPAS